MGMLGGIGKAIGGAIKGAVGGLLSGTGIGAMLKNIMSGKNGGLLKSLMTMAAGAFGIPPPISTMAADVVSQGLSGGAQQRGLA